MGNSAIQVGEGGSKHKLRRALIGVGVVVLVAVLAAVVGAGVRWFQQQRDYDNRAKPEAITQEATTAQNQALGGNFDQAHETINKALDNPNLSTQAKYDLYMQQGVTYEGQKNYDAAMESYRKAESLKETTEVTSAIASLAESRGDKQTAITYYKKAIPLIPEDDAMKDSLKKYFEDKVTELEGGVVNHE